MYPCLAIIMRVILSIMQYASVLLFGTLSAQQNRSLLFYSYTGWINLGTPCFRFFSMSSTFFTVSSSTSAFSILE